MYPNNVIITQHAVGQGGMLSGCIHNNRQPRLHWVYDCGSKQRKRCQEEIKSIKDNGPIDVLFLSHLHADHINEIQNLINTCKVKEVVLPFLNDSWKYFALFEALINNELTKEYANYVSSPEKWFTEQEVTSIIYINPVTPDEEINPLTLEVPSEVESLKWDAESLPYKTEESLSSETANVKLYKSHSRLIAPSGNGNWLLAPFAFSASDKVLNAFLDEFKKETGIDSHSDQFVEELQNLVGNKTKIGNLKKIYEKHWTNHNSVSMTLFMGTNNPTKIDSNYGGAINQYCPNCDLCIIRNYFHAYDWMAKCGWLATGDINLKDENCRSEFIEYYSNYIAHTGVFSVPHHGSVDNWDRILCTKFAGSHFLIEASKNNTYGHPSGHVVHDIVSNYLSYSWVSEDPQSSFICKYILL